MSSDTSILFFTLERMQLGEASMSVILYTSFLPQQQHIRVTRKMSLREAKRPRQSLVDNVMHHSGIHLKQGNPENRGVDWHSSEGERVEAHQSILHIRENYCARNVASI